MINRRTLPPGVTAGRRGRPTQRRSAAEREDIRRTAQRQRAALEAAARRRGRPIGGGIPVRPPITPPPPLPPFGFYRLPDENQRLWGWLLRQGRRPVWATTVHADGTIVHLWEKGGWRADYVLRRALLSNAGDLQSFFEDQSADQQVSPTDSLVVGVTVGLARELRRPAA